MNKSNRKPAKKPARSTTKSDNRIVSIVSSRQEYHVLDPRMLHQIQSLEVVVTDDLSESKLNELMEQCQSPAQGFGANVNGDILSLIQRILTPREWDILRQYVVEDKSLSEIGKASKPPVSGPCIRAIKAKALRKLRHPFTKNLLTGDEDRIFTEKVVVAMLKRY